MRVHKLFASTALRPMRSTWSFCGQRLGAIVFAAPLSSAVAAHSSSGLGTLGTKLSDPSLLRTEAFVAGEWTQGAAFQVTDPATGNVIAEVAGCRAEDVDQAVNAAAEAQVEWAALTGKARGQVLRNFFDLMTANSEDLALILTYEAGKPLAEARGEIAYAAAFLEWFSEESKRAYGSIVPATAPQRQLLVIKEPVGVAALITPWNFPSAMITRKLGPCLAAGCGAVIKPAEDTPLSALALAELADRAGVPKGLVSVLPCPRSEAPAVGRALATHAKIAKISFTGSTAVGVKLASQAARGLKVLAGTTKHFKH